MELTLGHGKVCYLEMPTKNVERSAEFYREVFKWNVRTREDGTTAFDDGVGQVSGTWVTGRAPVVCDAVCEGMMVYLMVEDAEATMTLVRRHGGEIVREIGEYSPEEIVALFRDPGGNVLGIYQEGGRKA